MSISEAATVSSVPRACFSLPALDEAIPLQLGLDARRAITLARFSSAAALEGVQLPTGRFQTIEEVVQAQWAMHTERCFGPNGFQGLAGAPEIHVTDSMLEVVVNARCNLDVYRLKPKVEELERAACGLGWFVSDVLAEAVCYGHEIYSMGFISHMLESMYWNVDEFTDEAFARAMLSEEGSDVPYGPLDPETIERLRSDYSYWPSEVLKEVDGHAHLLCMCPKGYKRPRRLKPQAVRKWLKAHPRHRLAGVVSDALSLNTEFARKDRAFTWNGHDDDTETLGALCFLAWDDPDLLLEAVSHHEQNALNGGQCIEAFARCQLQLDEQSGDTGLRQLARSTNRYLKRWALLAKLLSQFPKWESDDEV